ncbi:beta-lactamase/transpeptidase-like protein [Dothidotthia symphoricarpi CBS 119687]|uniref:Beta-lactamase/transpeptidase-like protein n=1 Tax=Dothidotthia symphoricarpi CBS 119687 TaxID=1392245 RepID=A0A6A6A9K5_9PLEO|nr:beta-lactamase/transpeptidase-like protein [Dothidotthia symphoricarpi CBS 119687]KAF2127855.1 beta-lactamase/transpeptidase-like protein [Dothidotthia symphoricarpi CBS 119687]
MELLPNESARARIQFVMAQISELRRICGVPSISLGILHRGEVLHKESFGVRNAEEGLSANADTLYLLSSLSKTFLSAAVGIAVGEGKMEWKAPLSRYIPDFRPSDAYGCGKANIVDFLRHTSGLSSPQLLILGPRGTLVHPEEDFLHLMNTCPTHDRDGARHNRWWLYNNWGYGLVALGLERVYRQCYADIIQDRILNPLGLERTSVHGVLPISETNVAYPYAKLENGSFHRLQSDQWITHHHMPAIAAMGMRSCVNDMLSWASQILDAERDDPKVKESTPFAGGPSSILHDMDRIRKGQWTRPSSVKKPLTSDTAYCMGWYKTTIPTPMLGFLSYNDMTRDDSDETNLDFIIGVESTKKELIAHNGVFCGSSCAFYTFSDTQSAIVVFANGQQDADAAEFAAQIITQALFDLSPKVDILSLARQEVFRRRQNFTDSLWFNWENGRDIGTTEEPREQYVGKYEGHATWLSIVIGKDNAELCVQFNWNKESLTALQYYKKDTYSFFPTSRDQYLKDSMIELNDHELALFYFKRNASGKVSSLFWKWDHEGGPSMFKRKDHCYVECSTST